METGQKTFTSSAKDISLRIICHTLSLCGKSPNHDRWMWFICQCFGLWGNHMVDPVPQCRKSKLANIYKVDWYLTTTLHSKTRNMCIIMRMYNPLMPNMHSRSTYNQCSFICIKITSDSAWQKTMKTITVKIYLTFGEVENRPDDYGLIKTLKYCIVVTWKHFNILFNDKTINAMWSQTNDK